MENDPNRQARYVKYVTIIRIGSWLYSGNTITGDPVGNALWPSYTAETNNWNKHKKVKNPDWPEANQLTIYKCERGVQLGTTENKSRRVVWPGIELVASL